MPYYKPVFDAFQADPERASVLAARLLKLRNQLRKDLPRRNVTESILIATWNLREFGRNQKFGVRLDSSLLCIAEIISHFDLVAVQEVNQNLRDLKRLREMLGEWWDYIVTDVAEGQSGNLERIAYLYDSRKIRFDHLAGEVALSQEKKVQTRQLARSPFICAFRSGWRRTSLCSVHIYYGKAEANDPRRVAEIQDLSGLLNRRNTKRENESDGEPENVILLGDFNIFNLTGDRTMAALNKNKFVIPETIQAIPKGSNLARDKYYDQIAFHDPKGQLKPTTKAGVFVFTDSIFADNQAELYAKEMDDSAPEKVKTAKDKNKFYNQWRTFQISDHFPLWIEVRTNFADAFLGSQLKRGREAKGAPAESKA